MACAKSQFYFVVDWPSIKQCKDIFRSNDFFWRAGTGIVPYMKSAVKISSMSNAPLISPLLFLCVLSLFVLQCAFFSPFTCDDAYITMRYAANVRAGYGLVFNPGERVEGYSHPLWLGLLICAAYFGFNLILATKLLGLMAALGTIFLCWRIVRVLSPQEHWLTSLALLPLITNVPFAVYTMSGLETALYSLWLAGIVYAWLKNSSRAHGLIWGCGLAAALTRPEGILIMAVIACWRSLSLSRTPFSLPRPHWLSMGAAFFLFTCFSIWRYAYFGDWLPNTFYAKPPGVFSSMSFLSPLIYVRDYLVEDNVWLWLALGLFLWRQGPIRQKSVFVALFLLTISEIVFVFYTRGDWMALHRFLVPLTPLLLACGVAGLFQWAPRSMAILMFTFIGCLNLIRTAEIRQQFLQGVYPYNVMAGQPQEQAGRWLRQNFSPHTLVACKRIGGIAYFSGCRILDMLGLVDRRLAQIRYRSPLRGEAEYKQMAAEIYRRTPDVIILVVMKRWDQIPLSQMPPDLASNLWDIDAAVYEGLSSRGYRFICRLPQGGSGELAVFVAPWMPARQLTPL